MAAKQQQTLTGNAPGAGVITAGNSVASGPEKGVGRKYFAGETTSVASKDEKKNYVSSIVSGKFTTVPDPNTRKHSDYVTHINNPEDNIYLRNVCYPVNMRLFKSSPEYRQVILLQCEYLKFLCRTTMEGYKKPHGMSAANAGLSFNIIAITRSRNFTTEYAEIMINPKILTYSEEKALIESNCGSLTLEKTITVERSESIEVAYYDENGDSKIETRSRQQGSCTIQHECEHNLGILIIDHPSIDANKQKIIDI